MTRQIDEILLIDGVKFRFTPHPPLPLEDPRIVELKDYNVWNSSCWRKYQGTWKITDENFFLVGLTGVYKLATDTQILAEWFSGILKLPRGNIIYEHESGLFDPVYEQELHIIIRDGRVLNKIVIENRPFQDDSYIRIHGPWKSGIVLDWHTTESHLVGESDGHPIFETTRSQLGELLYQFKYRSNSNALGTLVELMAGRLALEKDKFDLVIPIPPSNPTRTVTNKIATALANHLNTTVSLDALTKIQATEELKSIADPERRKQILAGVFCADENQISGMRILLVDDLYRSGSTLEAATDVIYRQGVAKTVYAFAVTRTRVHR